MKGAAGQCLWDMQWEGCDHIQFLWPESEWWVSGGAFFMDSYSDRDNVT